MPLTYRSSTPETRIIIERQPDGRQRVARAVKNPSSDRLWDLSVEHPIGPALSGTFNGASAEVNVALAQMLARTENEWITDRARGDRPPAGTRDANVRVYDDGRLAVPNIVPRWR
jgi:hypothetical protein